MQFCLRSRKPFLTQTICAAQPSSFVWKSRVLPKKLFYFCRFVCVIKNNKLAMAGLVQGVRSCISRSSALLRTAAPRAVASVSHQHRNLHCSSRLSAITIPSLLHNIQVSIRTEFFPPSICCRILIGLQLCSYGMRPENWFLLFFSTIKTEEPSAPKMNYHNHTFPYQSYHWPNPP